jgi:hypothetical protein
MRCHSGLTSAAPLLMFVITSAGAYTADGYQRAEPSPDSADRIAEHGAGCSTSATPRSASRRTGRSGFVCVGPDRPPSEYRLIISGRGHLVRSA